MKPRSQSTPSGPASGLSTAAWQRRLNVLESFEQAFQRGERPNIENYLVGAQDDTERRGLLVDLVHADLELRMKAGEAVPAEVYLERYPELRDAGGEFVAQFGEYREHLQAGLDKLDPDDKVEHLSCIPATPPPLNGHADLSPTVVPAAVPTDTACPRMAGYEILCELGRGGMGVVYKARQVGLNRVVALKMILAGEHAGPAEFARFKTEGEAIARLRHPNIVQVYEVGEYEGKPFFSLEFCEGGGLDKKLAGTPMPPRDAASLVQTLAEAMQGAHEAHIIHRDLKPGNVLLAACGLAGPSTNLTPKITDFGLAKKLDQQGQTQTGVIMGTPSYMAPEQAMGQKQVGPATDIYALGAILYECLTGRPPFKAATAFETLQQVVVDEAVSPAQLNAKVPRDLDTVCLKCLRKEPDKRYTSAMELADDLGRWQRGEPVLARPVGLSKRAAKWARRRPAVAGLLSGILLLTVTALGVISGLYRNAAWEAQRAQQAEQQAEAANVKLNESKIKIENALGDTLLAEKEAQWNFLLAQRATSELLRTAREVLRNKPGTEDIRRQLLAAGKKMAVPFTAAPSTTPAARLRAAGAHRHLGELEEALGDHKTAVADYDASLKLYRELMAGSPRPSWPEDYESEELGVAMKLFGALVVIDPVRAESELNRLLARFEKPIPAGANADFFRRYHAALLAYRALHAQLRGSYTAADTDYRAAARLLEPEPRRSGGQMELGAAPDQPGRPLAGDGRQPTRRPQGAAPTIPRCLRESPPNAGSTPPGKPEQR